LSFARTSYSALFAGVASFLMLDKRNRRKVLWLVVPITIIFLVVPAGVLERLSYTISDERLILDASSLMRIWLAEAGIRITLLHPLLGYGFSFFDELNTTLARMPSVSLKYYSTYASLHSQYISTLVKSGLLGLLAFLWLLVSAFRLSVRLFRSTDDQFVRGISLGFACGLIALGTSGLTVETFYYTIAASSLWFVAGCLTVLREACARQMNMAASLLSSPR